MGDRLEFTYAVNNSGSTVSMSTACTVYGSAKNGFYSVPAPPHDRTSDAGYVPPGTGCPRTFPAGANTTLVTETIAAVPPADVNKTLCRTLVVNPAVPAGTDSSVEVCVPIVAKPYMRVYGGDVSAGNGQTISGSCSPNQEAAVVTWNRGPTGGYSGAGAQFATLALNEIFEFSTSLGNTGGAPPPRGLAFANTSASGGMYGGNLGSAPCIPDFWDTTGAASFAGGNISGLATGKHTVTGPITLSGTLGAGRRVSVYVTGNVLIDGDITYPASWTSGSPPVFELVVRGGNIYISQTVGRLDGIYIAQPAGSNGGAIITCANPALPVAAVSTSGGTMYTSCRNKLIINGAFVANQVQFLRTNGSLRQATTSETGPAGTAAEVFHYSPALWMGQPAGQDAEREFDAITSLPPIL